MLNTPCLTPRTLRYPPSCTLVLWIATLFAQSHDAQGNYVELPEGDTSQTQHRNSADAHQGWAC